MYIYENIIETILSFVIECNDCKKIIFNEHVNKFVNNEYILCDICVIKDEYNICYACNKIYTSTIYCRWCGTGCNCLCEDCIMLKGYHR